MASSLVTRDVESRLKNEAEHIFEVFLEIHEPVGNEPPTILITYPSDYSDEILKTAANFAYPCRIPADEQSEHFTFVVLDSSGSIFRFGYCRRSNRESTCLCLISYFPWFETFYTILDDLSQIINTKPFSVVEQFLTSLYNYPLLSLEEFHKNEARETFEIQISSQLFRYCRPDLRKLPSVLSNRNFSVMFSLLGPDLMLRLFTHLLLERRILFVSSKLFHLTACACGSLHLIYPMHWQSIFLPILPESLSWTIQCTAPFIIGIHSTIFSKLNRQELEDVTIVNIDRRTLQSPHNDLDLFPKDLLRSMRKGIEQSSQIIGDHLARVFLRSMAFLIGDYGNGFLIKNNKLDFDRDLYLKEFHQSPILPLMLLLVNTQMFEQFSRYRTVVHLQREIDVDEFDIEVKNFQRLQQSRKLKPNRKIYKMLEKATNPLIEQVQDKTEQLQAAMNKIAIRNNAETEATSRERSASNQATNSKIFDTAAGNFSELQIPKEKSNPTSRSSTPELFSDNFDSLIDLGFEHICSPQPVVESDVAYRTRQAIQIDSKIKQLQEKLQYQVQTFQPQQIDSRDECVKEKTEIQKLVQQFDPLNNGASGDNLSPQQLIDMSVSNPETTTLTGQANTRHPSIQEVIPSNHVHRMLQVLQANHEENDSRSDKYATTTSHLPSPNNMTSDITNSNLIDFD